VNLDGDQSEHVRRFFIENALHWLTEYHVDGFRLDATHALADEGPRHFLAELVARIREAQPRAIVIAEDERKLQRMITPAAHGGWDLDAVWADDFHHHVRRLVAGDSEGYFARYSGAAVDLARTILHGWQFRHGEGEDDREVAGDAPPAGPPHGAYVFCLQNHDQVGNRAHGERLHHQVDRATWCAATTLLLCAPETPLLFMGQEWAASSPFLYFTDHPEPLGGLVTEGRREEFRGFASFRDPALRLRIPDPQAWGTFDASRLAWDERTREPHASVLRLYESLITLRRTEPALYAPDGSVQVSAADPDSVALRRETADGRTAVLAVVRLRGAGMLRLSRVGDGIARGMRHVPVLSTESPAFAPDSLPVATAAEADALTIAFLRPGAVVFRR
jgi:maltooligosyltrehalose trehalohydrolase